VTTIAAVLLGYWRWRSEWLIQECRDIYAQGIALGMNEGRPVEAIACVTVLGNKRYLFGVNNHKLSLAEAQERIQGCARRFDSIGGRSFEIYLTGQDVAHSLDTVSDDPLSDWLKSNFTVNDFGIVRSPDELADLYRRMRP
jgi:hypothetical protein